jgi:phytanoyl-CoA hydroxylase
LLQHPLQIERMRQDQRYPLPAKQRPGEKPTHAQQGNRASGPFMLAQRPTECCPRQRLENAIQRNRKDFATPKNEIVGREHDFGEKDSMLVMLLPKHGRIEVSIPLEVHHRPPVIRHRQGAVHLDNRPHSREAMRGHPAKNRAARKPFQLPRAHAQCGVFFDTGSFCCAAYHSEKSYDYPEASEISHSRGCMEFAILTFLPPITDPYREPPFIPQYRSRFGGLWTDLSNAPEIIAGKLELGTINRKEAESLRSFIENGFVVFPGTIPGYHLRQLNRDIERIWTGTIPDVWVGSNEDGRSCTRQIRPGDEKRADQQIRLLDLYEQLESARAVMFDSMIARFLQLIFERPVLAHQGLTFYRGSRQSMHRDSAFVRLTSPMEFAAAWIALEDIQEGSGELEYYPRSHLYPDYLFEGKYKWLPPGNDELDNFYADLRERAKAAGTSAVKFRPRAGDVFIWSADLAHGGSSFDNDNLTRRSFVVHYCPLNVEPMYYTYSGNTGQHKYRKGCYYTASPKSEWRSGPAD